MSLSRYSCAVLGEDWAKIANLRPATVRRMRAWCISLHIPVSLWAGSSYLVAREVFGVSTGAALGAALSAAALIYSLERIILASPKSSVMATVRLLIGLLTAVLGASAVDLVVFDKEISRQLYDKRMAELGQKQAAERARLHADAEAARRRWETAHDQAQCEGNGTCGSRVRSAGPLYNGLLRHAEQLRLDYEKAATRIELAEAEFARQRKAVSPGAVMGDAGMLMRVQALHDYLLHTRLAAGLWAVFFLFVLLLELSVVLAKFAFGETADDVIDRCREAAARHRATGYLDAITSPVAFAHRAVEATYR